MGPSTNRDAAGHGGDGGRFGVEDRGGAVGVEAEIPASVVRSGEQELFDGGVEGFGHARGRLPSGSEKFLHEGSYHRRVEIETALRELKTVQGMEGKLCCRTPETIGCELGGHAVLYLLIGWLMVEAAEAYDTAPLQPSFNGARTGLADFSSPLPPA